MLFKLFFICKQYRQEVLKKYLSWSPYKYRAPDKVVRKEYTRKINNDEVYLYAWIFLMEAVTLRNY